ncbi:MAG: radical SAM protein [Thaumarchaeota archaeon]|nr:radical SAM protein [Nitrososphaerota archaeon]
MSEQVRKVASALTDNSSIADVFEKALQGERLTLSDGTLLMKSEEDADIHAIGAVADTVRRKNSGDTVTFAASYNLSYSNICVAKCPICAFYVPYRRGGTKDPRAYTLTVDQALDQLKEAIHLGATEIHTVGGLNPDLSLEYYESLISAIKKTSSSVTVKALTLAEIHFIAKITGNSVHEVLSRLKAAGLDATTGGGAEIFDEKVRAKISSKPKCSSEDWLRVAEEAHKLGIPGNSTMLYGHVEQPEHRVDHILKLRDLQDRVPGFLSFIPLKYSPEKTALLNSGDVKGSTSPMDDLKVIAVSRLLLASSINNISVYWVSLGKHVAQTALMYGGNDLVGTAFSEKVFNATGLDGATTGEELAKLITAIGRTPAERNTFYDIVRYL